MMNDYEKARAFICDKNNSLTKIEKSTGISYSALSIYRASPEKLKGAAWEKVYQLAQLYDEDRHA